MSAAKKRFASRIALWSFRSNIYNYYRFELGLTMVFDGSTRARCMSLERKNKTSTRVTTVRQYDLFMDYRRIPMHPGRFLITKNDNR